MSDKTRDSTGARLPLFLLFAFLALLGGIAVWLELSPAPEPVASAPPAPQTVELASVGGPSREDPPVQIPPEDSEPVSGAPAPPAAASPDPASPAVPEPPETTGAEPAPPPAAAATPDASRAAPAAATETPAPDTPAPPANAAPPRRNSVQIARLPPVDSDPPLPPAPDPDLIQETTIGPLPQRSSDGRMAWRVYAKPFNRADKRPRVAIVVTGLGLSAAATESAIQGLPGSVTLAFAPYTPDLNGWIRLARAAGHEVLLNVPMEPVNYPAYDPGPQTLLTSLNEQGNMDRLLWILSRGSGYVGIIDFMGSRFTASPPHLAPVLAALRDRGLLYLDSGSAARSSVDKIAPDIRIPWASATVTLDERASRTEIDRRFAALEQAARTSKRAIGVASPYPVSLERIATWSRQLVSRGIAVAPVSAMVDTRPAPAAN